jgi:hypothetical protein
MTPGVTHAASVCLKKHDGAWEPWHPRMSRSEAGRKKKSEAVLFRDLTAGLCNPLEAYTSW